MKLQFSIQWSYAGRTPEGTPAEESAYYTGAEQDQSMQARLISIQGVALGLPQRSRHTPARILATVRPIVRIETPNSAAHSA